MRDLFRDETDALARLFTRSAARRNTIDNLVRRSAARRSFLAALLCALSAAVVWSTTSAADAQRRSWGTTTMVTVALRDLPVGHRIARGDFRPQRLPASLVGGAAVLPTTVGATVAHPIHRGDIVRPDDLVHRSTRYPLAPPGSVAVAIPSGPAVVPAQPGDHVVLILRSPSVAANAADPTETKAPSHGPPSVAGTVVGTSKANIAVAVEPDQASAVGQAVLGGSVAVMFQQVG